MAYKFQIGLAKLSGSITQTDGTITALGLDNSDANATNFGQIEADAIIPADASAGLEIDGESAANDTFAIKLRDNVANALRIRQQGNDYLKFTTTNSSELIESHQNLRISGSKVIQFAGTDESIGMAADFGSLDIKSVADIKLSGSTVQIVDHDGSSTGLQLGETLVTATATELNNLGGFASATYAAANDSVVFLDSDGGIRSESNDNFLGAISAEGLEVNSNQLRIKNASDGALTFVGGSSDELSVQLSGSSLSKNGNGLSLSDTIPGARTFSDNVTIQGDLTVQGTTTTVDSTTINISSSFTFEGPADDFETTLHAGTPIQDATIYLPQISGSGAQTGYLLALANDPGTSALTATRANLDLMAAGAGSTASLVGADGIVIFDSGNSDNPKKVLVSDITALAGRLTSNARADSETLTIGMNYFADLTSTNAEVTLPASPSNGDIVYVKAGNLDASSDILIQRAGSQTIDGENAIILESPFAAVTLVYVANNDWRIV